jgi:hypothetical protein
MEQTIAITSRFESLALALDERTRRLLVAAEAKAIGYGGISAVSRATGISRDTIGAGLRELQQLKQVQTKKTRPIRHPGGGRKSATEKDPCLISDLECLIEPVTRGDPESPLRWTCKSVRQLANELNRMGHRGSYSTVARILQELGYSLQANVKTEEGSSHPDRNEQFEHINQEVGACLLAGTPVISVDAKKRELVGAFRNPGRELRPKGQPERVQVHDFEQKLGHAIPYGVLDLCRNEGWVSVGIDHNTASFAAETIRRWWTTMGKEAYPNAQHLLITADGGGSNNARSGLWKLELQNLADHLGFPVSVCHFPPGTSKWNKIEHRLFSFISQNWRGKPLISHEVVVNLIRATKTRTGLKVRCAMDKSKYPTGLRVSKETVQELNIVADDFHGDWNYTVYPSYLKAGY